MKWAYPINDKGETTGEVRMFSDLEWSKISAQRVKRWVETENPKLKVVEKTVKNVERSVKKEKK